MINVDIINKLIPNPITLIVQLCSTLVLFLLAKKFLWKAVKQFFEAREEKMQSNLSESEQAKKAALSDRDQARQQLQKASGKAGEIVDAAVKEANNQKDSILAAASKEAEDTRKKAQEQIEQDRRAMQDSLHDEVVNVAMDAAAKLIGGKADSDMDRKAVDAFVKEASNDQ